MNLEELTKIEERVDEYVSNKTLMIPALSVVAHKLWGCASEQLTDEQTELFVDAMRGFALVAGITVLAQIEGYDLKEVDNIVRTDFDNQS